MKIIFKNYLDTGERSRYDLNMMNTKEQAVRETIEAALVEIFKTGNSAAANLVGSEVEA